MHKSIKWAIVAALGLVGAGCTLATVDLTQEFEDAEKVEEISDHVALPWRMVPPVKVAGVDGFETHDDPSCAISFKHPGKSECFVLSVKYDKVHMRYGAAAEAGKWPVNIGLEYSCTRTTVTETVTSTDFLQDLNGDTSGHEDETEVSRRKYHDNYFFFSIGGFTEVSAEAIVQVDTLEPMVVPTSGEDGKFIAIEDKTAIEYIRRGGQQITITPNPAEPGVKFTFELDGARTQFNSVDRLCYDG